MSPDQPLPPPVRLVGPMGKGLLIPCPGCGQTASCEDGHHLCRRCEGYGTGPAPLGTVLREDYERVKAERENAISKGGELLVLTQRAQARCDTALSERDAAVKALREAERVLESAMLVYEDEDRGDDAIADAMAELIHGLLNRARAALSEVQR